MNTTLLLGCNTILLGSYGEQNQTLEAFAQRIENVFKFQNSMTNALMLSEIEPSAEILNAEKNMQTACEPLNEAGSLQFDGLSVNFELAQRIQQTAESCEKAAQQLQSLLSLMK